MLPRNQRLASNRIEYLLKKGKKNGNTFFTIKYLPNNRAHSRFCVIVSTKIFAKAVQRNQLRRQLYEFFRLHPELPVIHSDLVVIAKTTLIKSNSKDITKNIVHSLQNLIFTS